MKFGFSHGDAPYTKSLELLRAAERAGFDQAWTWDSHIIWQDAFSLLGWLIGKSKSDTMEFGTMVNNPRTRDPIVLASAFATMNQITDGRMICGIGRGDSSVRVMGRSPANLAAVEEAVEIIRTLGSGQTMDIEGADVQMPWASGRVPVYVAAYGPKALRLAGRVGDGVIFQIADPFFIEWGMNFVRAGAEEAGRDVNDIVIHCATATLISDDLEYATEQCRWFPAVVGNHIADVLRHDDQAQIPEDLRSYVENRSDYDYRDHAEQGTEHSHYVPDEIVKRFCVIGNVHECKAKLQVLADLGVSEFDIYPHVDEIYEVIETYGSEIAPSFR